MYVAHPYCMHAYRSCTSGYDSIGLCVYVLDNGIMQSCAIFCTGPVLSTMQWSGLFSDSKTFVDMPLRYNPQLVIDDFFNMPDYSNDSLVAFLHRNFHTVGSDVLPWLPPDYSPSRPNTLPPIYDTAFDAWALQIHRLWPLLGKQIQQDVCDAPQRHTLLPLLSAPYMVVPGGRFREFYYWDSYWILKGLYISNMTDTATIIINNFLFFVDTYGFVPNGARIYYLSRSQPPLLTFMCHDYYMHTKNESWLKKALPLLEQEYIFWMTKGQHAVQLQSPSSNTLYTLNRYYTAANHPRPESYVEDEITANALFLYNHFDHLKPDKKPPRTNRTRSTIDLQSASDMQDDQQLLERTLFEPHEAEAVHMRIFEHHQHTDQRASHATQSSPRSAGAPLPPPIVPNHDNDPRVQLLFRHLIASAETGWDFSSRWFADRRNLSSAETMNIIPVDLNAILYGVEEKLAHLFEIVGLYDKQQYYSQAAEQRKLAIHEFLWDENTVQWKDYDFVREELEPVGVLSNFIPLWTRCYDSHLIDDGAVIAALLQSGLVLTGGLVTTLNDDGQQWDWPNAWPPTQVMPPYMHSISMCIISVLLYY